MVRKTSDIALLLGSRSKSRHRSGFGPRLGQFVDHLLGRGWRRDERGRHGAVSGWVFLGGVLVAFGGGFLVGGRVGGPSGPAGLAAVGRTPEFVGEVDTRPLADTAFIVSAYPYMEPAQARARAAALCGFLSSRGLAKARPYEYALAGDGGPASVWVAAVYFQGSQEELATRRRLESLPLDVPDEMFVQLRKSQAEWPRVWPIR